MIRRARDAYGRSLLHLAGHLAFFALVVYVATQLTETRATLTIALWIVAAALLHDLVFLPAYGIVDRLAARALPRRRLRVRQHVRVVAVVTGVLLLAWFPVILGFADDTVAAASGLNTEGYGTRWLVLTGALVVLSALAYAVRVARTPRVDQLHDAVDSPADEDAPRA